jgi:hypothetical protein
LRPWIVAWCVGDCVILRGPRSRQGPRDSLPAWLKTRRSRGHLKSGRPC